MRGFVFLIIAILALGIRGDDCDDLEREMINQERCVELAENVQRRVQVGEPLGRILDAIDKV